MKKIVTVKDLIEALSRYPEEYSVIGICQGARENEGYVRSLTVEQAAGQFDKGEKFDMPVVHVVLDKNTTVCLLNKEKVAVLHSVEH